MIAADRSAIPAAGAGAVYKGLAMGSNSTGNFLFATNFRSGQIDVFDKNFTVVQLAGAFADPNLPSGFAPFGIKNLGGEIYVTYARQDAAKHDTVNGAGNGVVNVFDTSGNFKRHLAVGTGAGGSQAEINSPWGLEIAPASFGAFSSAVLVFNFGDGRINAFNATTGAFLGQLMNSTGTAPISVPGLWGARLGTHGSRAAGVPDAVFFTAGLGDPPGYTSNTEHHGLVAEIRVAP